MGRKNRRSEKEYRQRLGFNPGKYTKPTGLPASRAAYMRPAVRTDKPYRIPYRGEIWVAHLGSHPNTSVQEGSRPVLIVSNDKGNHTSNTVVVLPLTSQIKRSELPSHVELRREDVVFALDAISDPVSLYEPLYTDGGENICVMDQLGDAKNTDEKWLEQIALRSAISTLGIREKRILSLRFYAGRTQAEVAKEIGISQAQVSRLEKSAIHKIKKEIVS